LSFDVSIIRVPVGLAGEPIELGSLESSDPLLQLVVFFHRSLAKLQGSNEEISRVDFTEARNGMFFKLKIQLHHDLLKTKGLTGHGSVFFKVMTCIA